MKNCAAAGDRSEREMHALCIRPLKKRFELLILFSENDGHGADLFANEIIQYPSDDRLAVNRCHRVRDARLN